MKKILSGFIVYLFISGSVYSQYFDQWTDHVPLTDSLSNNTNPSLVRMEDPFPMKLMMVWEKSVDSLSTSVYIDNILDTISEQLIISDSGIHYTKPQIMYGSWYPYDTLFYVLYETNQNGNQDIYIMAYLAEGIWGSPAPFANSLEDETQLSVGFNAFWDKNKDNYLSSVAWICNGRLNLRNFMIGAQGYYFGEDILIDSNFCSDPSINNQNELIYTKSDSAGSRILKSIWSYPGTWGEPQLVYEETNARNPTTALHLFTPCWSANQDSSWTIMLESNVNTYNISSEQPLNPAAVGMISADGSPQSYISICYPVDGYDEILMTPDPHSLEFENFSNSGTMNQNPQFFKGESESFLYHWWDYIVWESYRNNHWQIWSSKNFNGYSNVYELDNIEMMLSAHPNPFTHETTIEFTLDSRSDVIIEVYDSKGTKAGSIANRSYDQGEHQLRWNGEGLPAGVFIIKMVVKNTIYTSKLIKNQ